MTARSMTSWFAVAALLLPLTTRDLAAQAPAAPLTLAAAQKIIDAAQKQATAMNLRVSIAVVDGRGDLIAVGRMSGANPATPDTAIGKAMMSAMFGQPSAAFAGRGSTPFLQALNDSLGGRLRFFQGAVPIVVNGQVVGAVGASGATSQQDEEIAKAGLAMAM